MNGVLKSHATKPLFVCGYHPVDRNPAGIGLFQAKGSQVWTYGLYHQTRTEQTWDWIHTVGVFPRPASPPCLADIMSWR